MKKIKLLLITCLALLNGIAFAQQFSNIEGTITTVDGKPVAYVNVELKNTKYKATTNDNGYYSIKKVIPGAYTVVSSYVGLQTQEKPVNLTADQTTTLNFEIVENSSQLQEVFVLGSKHNQVNSIVAKILKRLADDSSASEAETEVLILL